MPRSLGFASLAYLRILPSRSAVGICISWWVCIAMFWAAMLMSPWSAGAVLCDYFCSRTSVAECWHERSRQAAKDRRRQDHRAWKAYKHWLKNFRYKGKLYRQFRIRFKMLCENISPDLICITCGMSIRCAFVACSCILIWLKLLLLLMLCRMWLWYNLWYFCWTVLMPISICIWKKETDDNAGGVGTFEEWLAEERSLT